MKSLYLCLSLLCLHYSLLAQLCPVAITVADSIIISSVQYEIETIEPGQSSGPLTPAPLTNGCLDLNALPPVSDGGTYRLRPSRTNSSNVDGVSALDIIIGIRHINQNQAQDLHAQIALDVDASLEVDIADLVDIQKTILYIDPSSLDFNWVFVDADFTAPDLSQGFPSYISIDPQNLPSDLDFYGIKKGDANGSGTPFTESPHQGSLQTPLVFKVEDQSFQAGDLVNVVFRAQDFVDVLALQATMAFDPNSLAFGELHNFKLPNLGFYHGTTDELLDNGNLTMVWLDAALTGLQVDDQEVLFEIQFEALQSGKLSEVLDANSRVTHNKVMYVDGVGFEEIVLDFGLSTATSKVAGNTLIGQAQPNPIVQKATIDLKLAQSQVIQVTIYNTAGQLIYQKQETLVAGEQQIALSRSDFGADGLYFYTLRGVDFLNTGKILVK